jgi:anthranilate phosphoribosyltransferase
MTYDELKEKLEQKDDLTREESKYAVFAMMEECWLPDQTRCFLIALHEKGETVDEIVGFAEAMRVKAVRIHLNGQRLLDTCGTGGDKKRTFNISTIAAFVLAGCRIPVVKHGNRAASSACGSADLLQALGISCRMSPDQVPVALERTCFAFLFAPAYHPATRAVAEIRRQIHAPTIFNLLGPLTNPASPAAQLIGVYEKKALPLMERALRKMDPEKRAMLIHSSEGHDEATLSNAFFLHSTFGKAGVQTAAAYGFNACADADLCGGSPQENARIAMEVLKGTQSPQRDTVSLNAVLGYLAFHEDASIDVAREAVRESIDSGAALRVVQKLREAFPA